MSLSFFLPIYFLVQLVSSDSKLGPTAVVSIYSESSYVLGRECATCCLWYNGDYPAGTRGYYDLAIALSCGAGAMNGCYCKADFASSASSYISACVSDGCSAIGDVTGEVKTMMDLYDGYCKTANVDVSTTAPIKPAASTAAASTAATSTAAASTDEGGLSTKIPTIITTGVQRNALASSSSQPLRASSGSTTAASTTQASANAVALGKSDIIAIGVGLGVGIPSLLLGLATLCVQIKRRRKQKIENDGYLLAESRY